ncbi:MAG: SIS domain-containing protein [Candidatus Omnitrophica bacterium]|nr:SIS domain-containing protein [Candidatus Omnitrophota bacterium]
MEDQRKWFSDYFEQYRSHLFDESISSQLIELAQRVAATHAAGRKLMVAGNGGSAAIASHAAVDFTKAAGVRCVSFNEPALITCFANDFGYERWIEKAIEYYSDEGDLVILISSSGQSPNVVRAARAARDRALALATFTGFEPDNPLRALGQPSLWVDSKVYNVVENVHQIWLLAVCDRVVRETARIRVAQGLA